MSGANTYNKIISTVNSVTTNYQLIPDISNIITIDTSNNRIGIGTLNPEKSLHIKGDNNSGIITTNLEISSNPYNINSGFVKSNLIPDNFDYSLGQSGPTNDNSKNQFTLGDPSNPWHSIYCLSGDFETVRIGAQTLYIGDKAILGLDSSDDVVFGNDINDSKINFKFPGKFNANVEISNNLLVQGDASFNSNVTISNNLLLQGDASFNTNVEISNNLFVNTSQASGSGLFLNNNKILSYNGDYLEIYSSNIKLLGSVRFANQPTFESGNIAATNSANTSGGFIYATSIGLNPDGTPEPSGGYFTFLQVRNLTQSDTFTNGALTISGGVGIAKNLNVGEKLNILGDASFNANVEISNNLIVQGDASFNANVEISNNLLVQGDASFNANVEISNNLLLYGDASFNANVEISNNLLVQGDASFNKNIYVDGVINSHKINIIDQNNNTKMFSIDISNNNKPIITTNTGTAIVFDSIVEFNQPPTFPGGDAATTQNIGGGNIYSTIIGYDSIGNRYGERGFFTNITTQNLIVENDLSVNNKLLVDTINEKTNGSGVTIDGVLIKDGDLNMDSITMTSFSVNADGDVIVQGDASFNGDVEISNNLLVQGDSSFNGDVEISNNLFVQGDASFNGDVEISNNLYVQGDASFNGDVEISNNLIVHNNASFNANVEISNNLKIGSGTASEKLDVDGSIKINTNILGTSETLQLYTATNAYDSYSFLELRNPTTTIGCPDFRILTNSSNTFIGTESFTITSAGNVGIGTTNPSAKLEVTGGELKINNNNNVTHFNYNNQSINYIRGTNTHIDTNLIVNYPTYINYNHNNTNTSHLKLNNDHSSGNQAYIQFRSGNSSKGSFSMGLDHDGNFRLCENTHNSGYQTRFYIEYAPEPDNPIIQLRGEKVEVHGNLHVFGNITSSTSDDRLKHNEIYITNGLNIINQLQPQFYQKTFELLDANYNGDLSGYTWNYEAGLIAQELLNSDISYVVGGGDYYDNSNNLVERAYYVNYNSIFIYAIAAIKELNTIIENQQTTITNQQTTINELNNKVQSLENENTLMKNALNELLSEAGKSNI